MRPNTSKLLLIGAVSLAAATGVTYATGNSSSPDPVFGETTAQISPQASTQVTNRTSVNTSAETGSISSLDAQQNNSVTAQAPASNDRSTVSRKVETCRVRMARINDPEPPLNVRSQPSTTDNNVVGQLKNGTIVTILSEKDGWFQIATPIKGWVSKSRTESNCNNKVERLSLSGDTGKVIISDQFIGTGSHEYVLNLDKGQELTIISKNGPFPTVIAPNGKALVGGPADEKRKTWTGDVVQSGEYKVVLDSNFRGYKYSFLLEIK